MNQEVRAVFFDFMGTCLDWHSSIVKALPSRIAQSDRSRLAIAWREAFFREIHVRFEQKLPPENIDITHARCLKTIFSTTSFQDANLSEDEQQTAVTAWHSMAAWPDVHQGLESLRAKKCEIYVLANGTTRLQLDLVRSSGLHFDMLFSSEMLGLTKPDLEIYRKALSLVNVKPENAVMVAAHAYDVRAAKRLGMKTIYIRRWTEDTAEDFGQLKGEFDRFVGTFERHVKNQHEAGCGFDFLDQDVHSLFDT